MEAGMNQNIPILPVLDSYLRPRSEKDRVVELFQDLGIDAAENEQHSTPHPIEDIRKD